MRDKDFLIWLHDRLEFTHHESYNVDFMYKLRAIINSTPEDKITPNCDVEMPELSSRNHK
jgi:hypothetical protein